MPRGSPSLTPFIITWGKCCCKTLIVDRSKCVAFPAIILERVRWAWARSTPACRNCSMMPSTPGAGARRAAPGRGATPGVDGPGEESPAVRRCASTRDGSPCAINPSARSRVSADDLRSTAAAACGAPSDLGSGSPPCARGGELVLLNRRVKNPRTDCRSRLPDGLLPPDASALCVGVSLPTRSCSGELMLFALLIPGIAHDSSEPTL